MDEKDIRGDKALLTTTQLTPACAEVDAVLRWTTLLRKT